MTRIGTMTASAIVVALSTGAPAQLPDAITIGTEGAYPPWNATLSDGTLQGFDVDLGNAICRELEIECTFVAQDWAGIIPALQNGRYDVIIAGMSITDEREEAVDFSNPYADIHRRFAAPADSPLLQYETWEEMLPHLDGAAVGVQLSTASGRFLEENYSQFDIRQYDTYDNVVLDLVAGRLDLGFSSVNTWFEYNDQVGEEALVLVGPRFDSSHSPLLGIGKGIAFREDDDALREAFNGALHTIWASGELSAMAERWFGFDVALPQPAP